MDRHAAIVDIGRASRVISPHFAQDEKFMRPFASADIGRASGAQS